MLRKIIFPAIALAATAAPVLAAVPAQASVTYAPALTWLSARPDSGNGGTWAYDQFTRTFSLTLTGVSGQTWSYTATIRDSGSFQAIPGALTPNQGPGYTGDTISGPVTGSILGSASYSFTASAPANTSQPNMGIPWSESGAPVTAGQTTGLWFEQAFPPGTIFTGPGLGPWGWAYTSLGFPRQQWVDSSANGAGDLPGDGNIS